MKVFLLLWFVLCASPVASVAQETFEARLVEAAKGAQVKTFDPALGPITMDRWVSSVATPRSSIYWEVNDCGEQTGSPADRGRDFPACVEAIFFVVPDTEAHVSIIVGTFHKGLTGKPQFLQAYLERHGRYREVRKLSEIALIAKSAQQAAEPDAGKPSGAAQ
ncbi:hypothetical protein [Thiohalomonas denitrificans]|uniref:hypothetical protein n=1 Tax=Thiohalomonas denitrificans TaxID=415747 RepID=UPI0026EABECE|nr:hypothetical protein [Thiohalomonas denitrificans]